MYVETGVLRYTATHDDMVSHCPCAAAIRIEQIIATILCWLVMAALASEAHAQEQPTSIHVVSPVWENYTNEDGTGLYWDVLKAVYEPVGIALHVEFVPWKRAIFLIETEKADAIPSATPLDVESCDLSERMLDSSTVVAIFKPETIPDWQGEASLEGKKVAWIRGYDFQMRLQVTVAYHEINNLTSGLAMLEKGYIDVLMDYREGIEAEKPSTMDLTEYRIEELFPEPMYMGFGKTPRGQQLLKIYDERIEQLYQSGELQKIYAKWGFVFTPGKFEFHQVE